MGSELRSQGSGPLSPAVGDRRVGTLGEQAAALKCPPAPQSKDRDQGEREQRPGQGVEKNRQWWGTLGDPYSLSVFAGSPYYYSAARGAAPPAAATAYDRH